MKSLFLVAVYAIPRKRARRDAQTHARLKYMEEKDFVFVRDPAAKHFEADWARRFPRAFRLVVGR